MALATYTDLQAAVASWLARDDLTTQIPDFIKLAEARINRELRVRQNVFQLVSTVSSQNLALPNDFVEVYQLTLDTESDIPLEYRPIEDASYRVAGTTSGVPRMFSIRSNTAVLAPAPDTTYTYTLLYYALVPSLSVSAPANWLLAKHPDLYLFGTLAEAHAYLLEADREQYWSARFETTKRSIHAQEARAKRTSGPRRARVLA